MTSPIRSCIENVLKMYDFSIYDYFFSLSSGGVPYPTLTNTELYRLLGTGYRMERPDMSSDEVYVSLQLSS